MEKITMQERSVKEFEEISVNWNCIESIEQAEKRKEILENEGYELIEGSDGFFKSQMIYMRRKKINIPVTEYWY